MGENSCQEGERQKNITQNRNRRKKYTQRNVEDKQEDYNHQQEQSPSGSMETSGSEAGS